MIAVITMYELYCEQTARSARYAALTVEWIAAITIYVLYCKWIADTATYAAITVEWIAGIAVFALFLLASGLLVLQIMCYITV